MLWIIHRKYRPESKAARAAVFPTHRAYMEEHQPLLLFAGALENDSGNEDLGNSIIIKMDSREKVQAFLEGDPYTQTGAFGHTTVSRIRRGRLDFGAAEAE